MEQSEARRIFVGARVAAAQRLAETGRQFLADPTDDHWFFFLSALGDISRLESSPIAGEALAGVPSVGRESRVARALKRVRAGPELNDRRAR
jgi:hypothetical protein